MKVNIGTIVDSADSLGKLMSLPLPATTSFAVARAAKAVKDPLAAYDSARSSLLERVGRPLEAEPGKFEITDHATWVKELDELRAVEIDIAVDKLACADFKDVSIEPRNLVALGWLVDL